MRRILLSLIVMLFMTVAFAADEAPKPYMGVYTEPPEKLPSVEGAPNAISGLQILDLRDNSPAFKAGLELGDIIVKIDDYIFDLPNDKIQAKFTEIIASHKSGDKLKLTVLRMKVDTRFTVNGTESDYKQYLKNPDQFILDQPDKAKLDLSVNKEWVKLEMELTLGVRPEMQYPPLPEIEETYLAEEYGIVRDNAPGWFESEVNTVVKRYKMEPEYLDLRERLRKIEAGDDGFRLEVVSAIHRNPFLAETIAGTFTDKIAKLGFEFQDLAAFMTANKPSWVTPYHFSELPLDADQETFKNWFVGEITPLVAKLMDVYKPFSDDDKAFIVKNKFDLTDAFSEGIYVHTDTDKDRLARNRRLIELGQKIDLAKLAEATDCIGAFMGITQTDVLGWMKKHPDIRSIETPWGKIGFGTDGNDRWSDPTFKFIYDPNGDDFYANGTSCADSFEMPISWICDFEGDDDYQATQDGAQGCGMPGVGISFDGEGDDSYIGWKWAQGVGYFGTGMLLDYEGDDEYRGTEYVQGAALFGYGILFEFDGDDIYNASIYSQGLGMSKGFGLLADYDGNDRGYCTGKYPTNYGDAGIYDSWSQGCGVGFRGIASGGIGIIVDSGGNDKWEAGNFSQGGGYYYGLGIFRGAGEGNDTYIGSRYAQGFCAHQAMGVFIEDAGNDRYLTRQGVNAGLAWDECVTLFIDKSGDDYYNGGTGFSLGASAHNAICLWLDKDGTDQYIYPAGPARAGGNDYHGGTSLSFFVDQGNGEDTYTCEQMGNDSEYAWPEYGVFRDGKGELKSPLEKPKLAKP